MAYQLSSMMRAVAAGAGAASAAVFLFKHAQLDAKPSAAEINMKAFTDCEVLKTRMSSAGSTGKTGPTKRITFGCKCTHQPISMVFVRASAEQHAQGENPITKFYNPVAVTDSSFDIEVKLYPEGKVSGALHRAAPGDVFQIKGPARQFKYTAGKFKQLAFVIGGTGITPSYQLIKSVLEDPEDSTKVTLIFGNKAELAVPLLPELFALQAAHKEQFALHFVIDEEEEKIDRPNWHNGRIDKDLLAELLPATSAEGVKIFVCGPGAMVKDISGGKVFGNGPPKQGPLTGVLAELGYTPEQVHKI